MPVPTETLWNIKRVNAVFALVATLTLAATGWMLWHDYDRAWRKTQTAFFDLRSAMAHFDVLWYETPEQKENRGRLAAAVEAAERDLATPENQARLKDLHASEGRLVGAQQGNAIAYGNLNAELQVKLFNVEDARVLHGPKDPRTRALQADYEKSQARVTQLKAEKDKIEDQLRDVRDQLKALNRAKSEAQKALVAYDKGRDDAERFQKMFGPSITRATINFPGLDFAAPKGTPGRQEVQQVFSKDIRFNYNFLDSYVTDRCITCHVGIDNPTYSVSNFVAKTEAAMKTEAVIHAVQKGNERLAAELPRRLGTVDVSDLKVEDLSIAKEDAAAARDSKRRTRENMIRRLTYSSNQYLESIKRPAIDVESMFALFPDERPLTRGALHDELDKAVRRILAAAPPLDAGGRALAYQDMSEKQRIVYVASLTAAMNLYLENEGRPKIDYKKEIRAHPHLDLYVSPKSPHPMRSMGCTVCHEGSGQDTDFVLAAHTPRNEEQKKHWEKEYYVREVGIPLATFHLVEEFWERPMMLPGYTSASCRKCHAETFDLARNKTLPMPSAERIVEGRDHFTKLGCINCHNVDGLSDSRRVGTDLTHVTAKLSTGFMEQWINYPNSFRPSTLMPHFFRQENNLPGSANEFDPDPILRTETEISAITYYLRTFSKPVAAGDWYSLPEGVQGDAKRGEELFTSIGCLACHANLDAKDPLDSAGRTIGEKWITEEFVYRGLSEEDAKKNFDAMSKNDRVRFAMRTFTQQRRAAALEAALAEDAAAVREERDPDPKKKHIPPVFTREAPELSGIGTKLINNPADADEVRRGTQWLYNWLRQPRHYSAYTKMPRMFRDDYYAEEDPAGRRKKNDQDILDVAAFLLSLRNDDFNPAPFADDAPHRSEAERLILMLLGGQNTDAVARKILSDEKLAPGDPFGRLTSAVVSQAAKSFGEGDAGRRRVQEIIEQHAPTLADRQKLFLGSKMIAHYGCSACHTIPGFEDATRPGTDLTLWAEKFMSQLDFAFFSPVFEHEWGKEPDVWGHIYPVGTEYDDLVRDSGGNLPAEVQYNHGAFAYHKFSNPRIWDRKKIKKPYEKLKMPNFFLSEEEARSMVTWILSMKQANVRPAVQIDYERTPAGKIARGRALVRELNCVGCHPIDGNQAVIRQFYSEDPAMADTDPRSSRFMPPLLWGEGAKVQSDWLFTFLNNVEMLRPWMKVRMPSFHLTDAQATQLVGYFAGLSQDESQVLREELEPIARKLQQAHGGAAAGDANWFQDPSLVDQAQFLSRYGVANNQVRISDVVSKGSTPQEIADEIGSGFQRAYERAEFLKGVFDIRYPFSDPTRHLAEGDRFKRGEELFYNLKCLACHVAGDPKAKGTTTDIKAPNFALTFKRLRYDWVIKWLQDPQAIQPGANMPQIFQGGSAFATMPQPQRDELESKFGKTPEEQSRLLVDFLYTLGEQRYTAIQPGAAEQAPAAEPGAEQPAEFDFDSGGAKAPTSQPADKGDFDF